MTIGKRSPSSFMTVAEMRADPDKVRALEGKLKSDGKMHNRRFEGSTRPDFVYEFVAKDAQLLECGPIKGPLTKLLQEKGYTNLHTLDFIDMLEDPDRSKLRSAHEIDFNMDRFPHADNSFDAVVCFGMVEHLENPFHFCREVARVLKPGGVFIMAIPNMFHIISRLVFLRRGMFPKWSYRNNHIALLPHGIFEKTILRDFTLEDTRYYKPFLHWFGGYNERLPKNKWFADYVAYILRVDK